MSQYSSMSEDLKILQDKDAVPLLMKKYDMISDGEENSKTYEPFIFFGEMPHERFVAFKKEITDRNAKSQHGLKYCFNSSLPLKHDSYDGVAVFLAQDYFVPIE